MTGIDLVRAILLLLGTCGATIAVPADISSTPNGPGAAKAPAASPVTPELRSRRESFAESTPTELADAHVVEIADGASEIAAEEVHEVKAEARSSRDFSRELGDFFDGLGPAAYAQEAPPVDDESDDETKTPS